MASSTVVVGMAEIHVVKSPGVLSCLGLGSCIGLVAFDPVSEVAGMIHLMLPASFKDKPVDKPGKFADTGLPEMLRLLESAGAPKSRLVVAYAGGAQVFKFGDQGAGRLDVGARNIEAVEAAVRALGIRPIFTDVGGANGRTVTVELSTGNVKVRTVNTGEKLVCNLRERSLREVA
ncbi:MAG: chemotaxis protein CheD [Armatimonadetes bacterium]|nr:chemotaxis protein CheD [Armatimonadota bacterium]